jgi:RimJ/RimL family protein N-acetyltransferase
MSLRPIPAIAPRTDDFVAVRPPDPHDIEVIARYIVRDDAQAWLSGTGDADALFSEYAAGWGAPDEANRLGLTLVVTRAGDDKLVGVLHLEPRGDVLHVAYGVAPDHRRAGIASHAVALCSAWALSNGFASVELEIGEENAPSQAVARRCGFTTTSRTRQQPLPDGGRWLARAWTRAR